VTLFFFLEILWKLSICYVYDICYRNVGSCKSDARQHCKTIQDTRKLWETIAGSRRGVHLLQCIGHSCRIFARNDGYGNTVTKGQKDPRLTVKTHVFNSTYDDDQKSSLILTMTIRRRHTPTTFISIQLTMTRKNRHTPTTFNYRYSPSLTKEICNRRSSRYRRKGIPGMGEGVERRQRDKRTG
jgi:hypothetical protein